MPEQPELGSCPHCGGAVVETAHVRFCGSCDLTWLVAGGAAGIAQFNRRAAHPTCATCGHWVPGNAFTNDPKQVCDLLGCWTDGAFYCASHTGLPKETQ